jgi:uncharacterized repeat protein (TIGR03847 family)
MANTRELGPVIYVAADAVGQPGQRRFRLRALTENGESAELWLEKEQLSALGEALEGLLKNEGYRHQRRPLDDRESDPVLPLNASIELQILQLSMGVNREVERVVLIGGDSADPDEADATTVSLEFDFPRAFELRRQISDVVAAGRPNCPLCTAPMDPEGHVCVRSNGHHPH